MLLRHQGCGLQHFCLQASYRPEPHGPAEIFFSSCIQKQHECSSSLTAEEFWSSIFSSGAGDEQSSHYQRELEVILMFSSPLQFGLGEQFPSVSLFPFIYFLRWDNRLLYNVTTKEFQQKDLSSIQAEVPAQRERCRVSFLLARAGGRDSKFTGQGQCSAVCKEKGENNTRKATEGSSGTWCSSLAPISPAAEEQK